MSDLRDDLERWERAGGTWRVVARTSARATVALCRCDGGEEVERLMSADPAVLDALAQRPSSDDNPWIRPPDPAG
ncbi:hypothetical protein FE697_009075 [Mumia zhuanghuii]|uniref:Uncharacterized protein n=2 Tax=Mumia TaxID=1546255 RepID=A0ABW1QUL2_9ACTN|nr:MULTISPECIES: hypothetical protein [Mumia]KAA1423716.1 hypothetical protein FE697_009075 [Mumia zhuanghuii]